MKVMLMGPPGAGKGSQAGLMEKRNNLVHISTGDIIRKILNSNNPIGLKAKKYVDDGQLVPDDMVVDIVKMRLSEEDCNKGFVLDGFPRTVNQAKALDEFVDLDYAINIQVPPDILIRRLTGRRICSKCGAIYHIETLKPQVKDICDHCGGGLQQRKDDNIDTVEKRLKVYNEQTKPLIDYYRAKNILLEIDGSKDVESVFKHVDSILREKENDNN